MKTENKYITVIYKLYAEDDGEKELVEEATNQHPFQFVSGLGFALEAFETEITKLKKGDDFNFSIPKEKAYGEYDEEHVIDLGKETFEVDGNINEKYIAVGKVVPLMDSEGRRVNGIILDITDDNVKVDLNHPLAGSDLLFIGKVTENRVATEEEISQLAKMISGEGCCGCDSCEGECEEHHCGEDCNHCN